jgi:hypothetical protein
MVVDMENVDELNEKFDTLKNEIEVKLINFSELQKFELQIRRKEFYLNYEAMKEQQVELENIRVQIKENFEEDKKNERYSLIILAIVYSISTFFDASDKTLTIILTIYFAIFLIHFIDKKITQTTNVVLRESKIDAIKNYELVLKKSIGNPYFYFVNEYTQLIAQENNYEKKTTSDDRLIKGIYDARLTLGIIEELVDNSNYLHRRL